MKLNFTYGKWQSLLLLIFIFGITSRVSAFDYYIKTGLTGTSGAPLNWNTASNWALGTAGGTVASVPPTSSDNVFITSGKFVSIPLGTSSVKTIATCATLNITGTGTTSATGIAATLYIQGFADLTCSSINLTNNGVLTFITTSGNNNSITCAGTITCGNTTKGALTLIGGTTVTCNKLTFGTGTGNALSVIGGRNGASNYGAFVFTGTGTGVVPVLAGDTAILADFSDVTFNPSSSTSVSVPLGFSALKLKIKANLDNTTINTVDFGSNYSQTFTGGTSLSMEKNTVLLNGGANQLPYSGYVLDGASTINYNGADQIIRGLPAPNAYTNLTLSGAGVKTLSTDGDLTIDLTLSVANGVTLKIADGKTLYINGTYTNTGTGCIRGSKTSNISYLGTADSSFNFDQTTLYGNALNNITIGALNQAQPAGGNHLDMIVTSPLNIYGTVYPIVGHLVTNSSAGNVVTLKGNASTTAFIGPIIDGTPDGVSDPTLQNNGITGNITVERYIPATRAYRGLSSSVTGGTIFSNWQENGSVAFFNGSILGSTLTTTPNLNLIGKHISGANIPANTIIIDATNASLGEYEISPQNVVNPATSMIARVSLTNSTIAARFTGSVAANVLTVTAFTVGTTLSVGQKITGGSLVPNTVITVDNGDGTYNIGLQISTQEFHYNGAPVGYGTHVTGISCTDAQLGQNDDTTGIDFTRSGNPSLFTYNNSTNAFESVLNTKTESLIAGKPYFMLVRGDRAVDLALNSTTPNNTTLRSIGTIVAGPVSISTLNNTIGKFNLIGNPYQAPVDLAAIYGSGDRWVDLGNSYTVFDTKANTRGAYVAYDFDLASSTIDGQTDPPTLTSAMSNKLQPNQAFFVTTSGTNPTLIFNETDKDVSSNDYVPMFRHAQNTTPKIKGSICNATTNKTLDGFILAFGDSFNNTIVAEDTKKMLGNEDETFASTNDVTKMAIDKRNFPSEADEIPLSITQYRLTNYVMKFNVSNFDQMDAYLIDTYTATETTLNNNEINSYPFTVDTSIPASIAENRFKIVFRNSALQTNSNSISAFAVYPNPVVDNKFTIKSNQAFSGKDANVTILNAIGQKVYSTNGIFSTDGSLLVNPTVDLSKGIYLVKVAVDGKVETKKLIIK